jgi:hypothetical protein
LFFYSEPPEEDLMTEELWDKTPISWTNMPPAPHAIDHSRDLIGKGENAVSNRSSKGFDMGKDKIPSAIDH